MDSPLPLGSLPLDPSPPDPAQRREQELQAQIAELKQDKERLIGQLDQALTALNNMALSRPEEPDPYRLPPPFPPAPPQKTARKPKEEFQPGTWAWLKNWFLNA